MLASYTRRGVSRLRVEVLEERLALASPNGHFESVRNEEESAEHLAGLGSVLSDGMLSQLQGR